MIPASMVGIFWIPQTHKSQNNLLNKYIVDGACDQGGTFNSKTPLTYRELFFKCKLKAQANLQMFNLDEIAPTNELIFIPYKNFQLHWKDLYSEKQLTHYKISSKSAKNILEFRKKYHRKVTWEQLGHIPSVGISTLKKLKKFLILN